VKKTELGLCLAVSAALMLSACGGDSAENLMVSARTHIRQNESKAAIIQLKNVLQKNATLPEARFLLGKMLLETRDPVGAALELGKARELGYPEAQIAPLMARVLILQNQHEKLLAEYGKVVLNDPAAQAELNVSLAAAYASQSQPRKARESIDAALKAAPENVRAQLFNVRLLATEGKSDEAMKLLDAALAGAAASSSEAWQIKGELLQIDAGDSAKSIESFRQALKLDKSNIAAHSGIINGLLRSKDVAGAEAQLAELKKLYPNLPQTRYHSAILALERKNLSKSAEEVQALLKMAPDNPQALFLAGYIEYQRGGLVPAVTYLAKALTGDPNNSAMRILLARTYMRTGEPNKALSTIQNLVDRKDAPSDAVAIAAEATMQLGDNKTAEALFERAAKLNPNDARSRTALALTQMSKGQAAEGFNQLQLISENDPGATADLALITVHMRRSDIAAALQAIDKLEKKTAEQAGGGQPQRPH
jgi:putative PEP-CTERM system TPR-repeat lipoprotein